MGSTKKLKFIKIIRCLLQGMASTESCAVIAFVLTFLAMVIGYVYYMNATAEEPVEKKIKPQSAAKKKKLAKESWSLDGWNEVNNSKGLRWETADEKSNSRVFSAKLY